MDDINEKLNSLLSNPQLMQQIMAMAQSINSNQSPPPNSEKKDRPDENAGFDTAAVSKIMKLVGNTGIDSNQKSLLRALSPYVTHRKIDKLERAMQAAKLASAASAAFGSQISSPK